MSDTLYLQLDQNIEVTNPHVYLQDIAALSMSGPQNPQSSAGHACDRSGCEKARTLCDVCLGSSEKRSRSWNPPLIFLPSGKQIYHHLPHQLCHRENFPVCEILFVCLVSFFGAAFSIMTFNNDVDMGSLFSQFYTLVTGKSSSGFTILEISYSIGIGLGVLIFFNHFGHLKLSDDPTPMQVQMRTYEDDVNRTLIEQAARTENPGTES